MLTYHLGALLLRVMRPTYVTVWVTIMISIVTVAILSIPPIARKLGFDVYFVALEQGQVKSDFFSQYQHINDTINSSVVAANISTFLVWSVIGLVSYFIVINLWKFIKSLINFFRLISYTFINHKIVAQAALAHLLVRCGTIGLILGFYKLFMSILLPVMLVLTGNMFDSGIAFGILYALASLLIMAFSTHIIVIIIRLIMTKSHEIFDSSSIAR